MAFLVYCSPSFADETVQVCGSYANNVFSSGSGPGITATGRCPTPSYNGGGFGLFNSATTTRGQTGRWQTTTPAGLELVGATASQLVSYGVNDGQDYGGGFYWAGGGTGTNDQTPSSLGMLFAPSSYFGMQLVCGKGTCKAPAGLTVGAFSLYVRETVGPSFAAPTGLWQTSGWIRGTWPVFVWGNSPSGLCSLSASLDGQLINTTTSPQDVSSWHQCAAPPINQPLDTSRYRQGAVPLTLSTGDAAGVPASLTKTVYIDNSAPAVSMSGPTDAPTTAGTQYVTATATDPLSGIAGLSCLVDGAPSQWFSGASASVPVSGVGQHSVHCSAANNAVDPAGNHGWSAPSSWSVKIGYPTIAAIGFSKIVDGLRCRRVREHVTIPARWLTVRRHHRLVKVRERAHRKLVKVTRCHPRTARRRILVWKTVHRHGRLVRVKHAKIITVPLVPRVVMRTARRVAFGHGTAVSGWLGQSDGTALSGQTVRVLSAPDNGLGRFAQVAVTTTATNGSWTTTIPRGPSQLVQANYDGTATTEASVSTQVHVIVPAKVKLLSVLPRRVAWGQTVRITGQLLGGYLPGGGALVRLRIGTGHRYSTYGVEEHVTGHGRFSTTYTFGAGLPGAYRSFWFQAATLPMGDYPYAPAASGRRSVLVGGHPQTAATRRRHGPPRHKRHPTKHRRPKR
ncbi:MAG: hypothetical protein ACRDNK_16135 [Solirubrobacteraceae bacterium]